MAHHLLELSALCGVVGALSLVLALLDRYVCGCTPQDRPRCELCRGSGWDPPPGEDEEPAVWPVPGEP